MFSFSRTSVRLSLLLLFVMVSAGCEKYYYLDPADLPAVCVLNNFTCTIDGNTSDKVLGFVNVSNNDNVSELSDWGSFYHNGNDGNIYFDFLNQFTTIDCRVRIKDSQYATSALYDFGSVEETFSMLGSYTDLIRIVLEYDFITSNDRTREHIIDNIVYRNGNLISYDYTEKLESSPNTVFVEESYTFEYDLNKTYDHDLYPNERFFTINYRPILGREYSFGERFDAQPFSKNVLIRKKNTTESKTVFENTYNFDSDGKITRLNQVFLYGGFTQNSLLWTYEYACE